MTNIENLAYKELVLRAVKLSGWNFQYANEELKNDKKFILEVVNQSGWALAFANEEVQKDKKFILEAVRQSRYRFEYVSVEVKEKIRELSREALALENQLANISNNE